MAFCGKMHDDVRPKILEDLPHCSRVANVGAFERKSWIVSDAGEIVEIASVSQLIDDADLVATLLNEVANHRRADDARTSEIRFGLLKAVFVLE